MLFHAIVMAAAQAGGAVPLQPAPTYVSSATTINPSGISFSPILAEDYSNCVLAVVCVSVDSSGLLATITTTSSGWVKAGGQTGTSYGGVAIFYKLNPTATETLTVTTSEGGFRQWGANMRRYNGADNVSTPTFGSQSTTANPDPPSHDPGAARNHIFICGAGHVTGSAITIVTAPSGYGNAAVTSSSNRHSSADRTAAATGVEDPGTWDTGGSNVTSVPYTFAIWKA